jgi:hypothetical protein
LLPLAAACIGVLAVARSKADALRDTYGDRWDALRVLDGLESAVRPGNPALWWPVILITLTAWLMMRWTRRRTTAWFAALAGLCLLDLAGVAAFVDVDTRTYTRRDLQDPPPLAEAIRRLDPQPGHRLLVPRVYADYAEPIAVLWPQTNLPHGIATVNGYGPFWPQAHQSLFRFQPWGSSEDILELLRNPTLMASMGIRFIAVRSEAERDLLASAALPAVEGSPEVIAGTRAMTPVRYGHDVVWPIRLDEPGLFQVAFDAEPAPGSPSQWFVRLENADGEEIGWTRKLQPADLATGRRRVRFVYRVGQRIGAAAVRIKSEMGQALSVGHATISQVASDEDEGNAITGPFTHRADLPGGVSLYELPGAVELVRFAPTLTAGRDLTQAVERLTLTPDALGLPAGAVVDGSTVSEPSVPPVAKPAEAMHAIRHERPTGHDLRIQADTASGGLLVFNETYDPGWRATIDDRPAGVLRVNGVSQGVMVPPGPHRVRFAYTPRGLHYGAALSALALAAGIVGLAATRGRPRA